jgi:hypothetical protein
MVNEAKRQAKVVVEKRNTNSANSEEREVSQDNKHDCLEIVEQVEIRNIYEEVMQIPLKMLRCLGLYHCKTDRFWFKLYSIFYLAAIWLFLFKFFTAFLGESSFSAKLIYKIVTALWLFTCCSLASILFFNQEKSNREVSLSKQFSLLLCYEFSSDKVRKLKKNLLIKYLIFLFSSFFNSISIFLSLFGPEELFNAFSNFLAPFQSSEWAQDSIPYKLFTALMGSLNSIYMTMTVATFLSHSQILEALLTNFNEKFTEFNQTSIIASEDRSESSNKKSTMNNNPSQHDFFQNIKDKERRTVSENEFERFRIWHLNVCLAVKQVDKCYSEFLALILAAYITISFLLIYVMSNWSGNCVSGILQAAYPFWFITSIAILALVLRVASQINTLVIIQF